MKPALPEFEDRPAIGDEPAGEITCRSVVLRFAVAFGILAALFALFEGFAFLRATWLDRSQKAEAAAVFIRSPTLRWDHIPDIRSLQIAADDAVTFSSKRTTLEHILADGSWLGHTFYISGDTGEVVNAPLPGPGHGHRDDAESDVRKFVNPPEDDALHLTARIGESCRVGGVNVGENYRLLRVVHGNCVFERSGWSNKGKIPLLVLIVKPYPTDR